eukprot:scaffold1590_cov239-Pinguiococcus_pyrenoidosus.AAC.8
MADQQLSPEQQEAVLNQMRQQQQAQQLLQLTSKVKSSMVLCGYGAFGRSFSSSFFYPGGDGMLQEVRAALGRGQVSRPGGKGALEVLVWE